MILSLLWNHLPKSTLLRIVIITAIIAAVATILYFALLAPIVYPWIASSYVDVSGDTL